MKKLSKIFIALIALLSICLAFSACGVRYHATVIDTGIEFTSEFLEESVTYYQGWHENEDYNPEDENSVPGWYDETLPQSRTYIVSGQSEADKIFAASPKFDFEKERVVVYCWSEIYTRKVILKRVKTDGDILKIKFTLKKPGWAVGDASMPHRRILVIKLKNVSFSSVEVTQV